jgi:hypothetical protein
MHQLYHQHAFLFVVDPADQHTHGSHSRRKGDEKGGPIGTVWSSGSEKIHDRQMPWYSGAARALATSLGTRSRSSRFPLRILPGKQRRYRPEPVGGIDRRRQRFQTKEKSQDQRWRYKQGRIPSQWNSCSKYSAEETEQTGAPVNESRQQDTCDTRPQKHGRKHQNTGEPRESDVVDEFRCGYEKRARPRDRESQREISDGRMAPDEGRERPAHLATLYL